MQMPPRHINESLKNISVQTKKVCNADVLLYSFGSIKTLIPTKRYSYFTVYSNLIEDNSIY